MSENTTPAAGATVELLPQRCFDAMLRVEHIFHLGTMLADTPDPDVIEWIRDNALDSLGIGDDGNEDDPYEEELIEALTDRSGWLVEAATPSRDRWPIVTWGMYRTRVFYATTYEGAVEAALTWAEAQTPQSPRSES